ncbi:MAG: sigma 54-interacting transcriptional regulator [Pseudomonadota bacterium]
MIKGLTSAPSNTGSSADIILLVDDNPTNLQVLYQTLQGLNFKILIAKNGEDALELANKSQPALILLDIMMPGMDGFEVLNKLKSNENTAQSVVIFLSALDEIKHKVRGLKLGAVDYIAKPFQSSEVIARVKTHLKIYHLERYLEEKNQQLELDNANILHSMSEGLIELALDGKIRYANQATLKMLGWNKNEILGQDFHSLIQHSNAHGERLIRNKSIIYKGLRERESIQSDELYFYNKQGNCFPVEFTMTPLFKNKESINKTANKTQIKKLGTSFILFKNISLRKKNDKELQQALQTVEDLKEKLQAENIYLQQEIKNQQNFTGIVGESKALTKVLSELEQVAKTDTTVLINGESGTGKEAIARAIHERSLRKDRPLIKVNCGAIAESIVESELFGHVKGAFTSAINDRMGHFQLADGGTIFLDEIGELSLEVQVKLLRVIQEQEIQPVGSQEIIHVDVRFIAATNRDLKAMVDDKTFRMDLFYRLNVFPLLIPPLRDRRSDIPLLIKHFLQLIAKKLNKQLDSVSKESLDLMMDYYWPGNIRELQNIIERSAILSQSNIVEVDDALLPMNKENTMLSQDVQNSGNSILYDSLTGLTLAENERLFIIHTLKQVDGVIGGKKGAAEILGVPVSTLRSRMKKLGLN